MVPPPEMKWQNVAFCNLLNINLVEGAQPDDASDPSNDIPPICWGLQYLADLLANSKKLDSLFPGANTQALASTLRDIHDWRREEETIGKTRVDEQANGMILNRIKALREKLQNLPIGESLTYIRSFFHVWENRLPIVVMVTKTAAKTYMFSVACCEAKEAACLLPVDPDDPFQSRRRLVLTFHNIPAERMLDDGVMVSLGSFSHIMCLNWVELRTFFTHTVLFLADSQTLAEALAKQPKGPMEYSKVLDIPLEQMGLGRDSHEFRVVVTAMRHLLLQQLKSAQKVDAYMDALRLQALESALVDLKTLSKSSRWEVSKQLQGALPELSDHLKMHQAPEEAMAQFENCRKALMAEAPPTGSLGVAAATFSSRVTPFQPFYGLDLVMDESPNTSFVGTEVRSASETLVDIRFRGEGGSECVQTLQDIAHTLSSANDVVATLQTKTQQTDVFISSMQGVAFVEDLFMRFLPLPTSPLAEASRRSKDPWLQELSSPSEAKVALNSIYQIMLLYDRFLLNFPESEGTSYRHGRQAVTKVAALVCYDALLRNPSLTKALKLSAVLTGENPVSGSAAGFMPAWKDFRGVSVQYILDQTVILRSAEALVAREAVLHYIEGLSSGAGGGSAQKPSPIFDWTPESKRDSAIVFEVKAEDVTSKLLFAIADAFDSKAGRPAALQLPEHLRDHPSYKTMTLTTSSEADRARWLLWDDWRREPEVRQYLDLIVLFKLGLAKNLKSAMSISKQGFSNSDTLPRWIAQAGTKGSGKVSVRLMMNVTLEARSNALCNAGPVQTSLARSLKEFITPDTLKSITSTEQQTGKYTEDVAYPTENDVLMTGLLPVEQLGNTLSNEESEMFFSLLCAPSVAPAALTSWLTQGKCQALQNDKLFSLYEQVLFEPGPFASSPKSPTAVPVPPEDRASLLATRRGRLRMNLEVFPTSVLDPLLQLCASTGEMSSVSSNWRSPLMPLFERVVLLLCDLLPIAYDALSALGEPNPQALKKCWQLNAWLKEVAVPLLRDWLESTELQPLGSFKVAFQRLRLHGLLALVASAGLGAPEGVLEASAQPGEASDRTMQRRFGFQKECWQGLVFHAGAATALLTRLPRAVTLPESQSFDVYRIITAMQRHRSKVLKLSAQAAEEGSPEVMNLMSRLAAVSLRDATLADAESGLSQTESAWKAMGNKPTMCKRVVSTSHPYQPDARHQVNVKFKGAPYIVVRFSTLCSMEPEDFVTIFKDASCSEFWGLERYTGKGAAGNWAGCFGRSALVVPADELHILIATDENGSDWGVEILLEAPVDVNAAKEIHANAIQLRGKGKADSLSVEACEQALARTDNDKEAAMEFVLMNFEELQKAHRGHRNKQGELAQMGIYRALDASRTQVSLQTGEVAVESRTLRPLPLQVHLLMEGRFFKSAPQCTLMEQHEHRSRYQVFADETTWAITHWRPISGIQRKKVPMNLYGPLQAEEDRPLGWLTADGFPNFPKLGRDLKSNSTRIEAFGYSWSSATVPKDWAKIKVSDYPSCPSKLDPHLWKVVMDLLRPNKKSDLNQMTVFMKGQPLRVLEKRPCQCGELLIFQPPSDDDLQRTPNAPGRLWEAALSNPNNPDMKAVWIYSLFDVGRRLQRRLVCTSSNQVTLRDSLFLNDSNPLECVRKMGLLDAVAAESVEILRQRMHSHIVCEHELKEHPSMAVLKEFLEEVLEDEAQVETCVDDGLKGLLPECLLGQYTFWRVSPRLIRGYPVSKENQDNIDDTDAEGLAKFKLKEQSEDSANADGDGLGTTLFLAFARPGEAVAYRAPWPEDPRAYLADVQAGKAPSWLTKDSQVLMLLGPEALTDKEGAAYKAFQCTQYLDSLAATLFWSSSLMPPQDAEAQRAVALSLVELPRVGLSFRLRRPSSVAEGGQIVLEPLEYLGWGVLEASDERREGFGSSLQLTGLETGLLLRKIGSDSEVKLLLPNYILTRTKARGAEWVSVWHRVISKSNGSGISTIQSHWRKLVTKRHFAMDLHVSGVFLQPTSAAASIYLCYLYLLAEKPAMAARYLAIATRDQLLGPTEVWSMKCLLSSFSESRSPACSAMLLRTALWAGNTQGKEPKNTEIGAQLREFYRNYTAQVHRLPPSCRLSVREEIAICVSIGAGEAKRANQLRQLVNPQNNDPLLESVDDVLRDTDLGVEWQAWLKRCRPILQEALVRQKNGSPTSVPGPIEVEERKGTYVKIKWGKAEAGSATNPVLGYTVASRPVPGAEDSQEEGTDYSWREGNGPWNGDLDKTSATIVGLKPNTAYEIRVRTVNSVSVSDKFIQETVTTAATTDADAILEPTEGKLLRKHTGMRPILTGLCSLELENEEVTLGETPQAIKGGDYATFCMQLFYFSFGWMRTTTFPLYAVLNGQLKIELEPDAEAQASSKAGSTPEKGKKEDFRKCPACSAWNFCYSRWCGTCHLILAEPEDSPKRAIGGPVPTCVGGQKSLASLMIKRIVQGNFSSAQTPILPEELAVLSLLCEASPGTALPRIPSMPNRTPDGDLLRSLPVEGQLYDFSIAILELALKLSPEPSVPVSLSDAAAPTNKVNQTNIEAARRQELLRFRADGALDSSAREVKVDLSSLRQLIGTKELMPTERELAAMAGQEIGAQSPGHALLAHLLEGQIATRFEAFLKSLQGSAGSSEEQVDFDCQALLKLPEFNTPLGNQTLTRIGKDMAAKPRPKKPTSATATTSTSSFDVVLKVCSFITPVLPHQPDRARDEQWRVAHSKVCEWAGQAAQLVGWFREALTSQERVSKGTWDELMRLLGNVTGTSANAATVAASVAALLSSQFNTDLATSVGSSKTIPAGLQALVSLAALRSTLVGHLQRCLGVALQLQTQVLDLLISLLEVMHPHVPSFAIKNLLCGSQKRGKANRSYTNLNDFLGQFFYRMSPTAGIVPETSDQAMEMLLVTCTKIGWDPAAYKGFDWSKAFGRVDPVEAARAGLVVDGVELARIPRIEENEKKLDETKLRARLNSQMLVLGQVGKAMSGLLGASRTTIHQDTMRPSRQAPTELKLHPHFLIIEFLGNLVLRSGQVENCKYLADAAQSNKSCIKQLIMGSGKTCVIAPLLSLLLADGKVGVLQICPDALLPMSRGVMASVFGFSLDQGVYTLRFERGTTATTLPDARRLRRELEAAIRKKSVVFSTPTKVKGILLFYLELLKRVKDASASFDLPIELYALSKDKELSRTAFVAADALYQYEQIADELATILRLWKERFVSVIDEVDWVLHPLKSELNFPLEAKKKLSPQPDRWLLPTYLLQQILAATSTSALDMQGSSKDLSPEADPVLQQLSHIVKQGLETRHLSSQPHLLLLSPEWYQKEMKPVVAKLCIIWLSRHKRFLPLALEDGPELTAITRFLEGPTSAEESEELQGILGRLSKDAEAQGDIQQLLMLGQTWVTALVPHCLSKRNRVDYGLINDENKFTWAKEAFDNMSGEAQTDVNLSRWWEDKNVLNLSKARDNVAVPFEGRDKPSKASEFASAEVLVGLTVLSYIYEGMRLQNLSDLVAGLKRRMNIEYGPFTRRPSNVMFRGWLESALAVQKKGGDSTGPGGAASNGAGATGGAEGSASLGLHLIEATDMRCMGQIFAILAKFPQASTFFLSEMVFPQSLQQKPIKIAASGTDVASRSLFRTGIGFTGTANELFPADIEHPDTKPHKFEKGTEANIVRMLTDTNLVSVTPVRSAWTPESLLERVAGPSSRAHALIDTGALITGLSNQATAAFLLENGLIEKGFKGVVFLDPQDRKMVLLAGDPVPVLLEECGLAMEDRFTYYDQAHTTGMDIKQPPVSMAFATLGKGMTLRDHAQGCWRMRGFGAGQTVSLLVVPEIQKQIVDLARRLPNFDDFQKSGSRLDEASVSKQLQAVMQWLVGNQINSEGLQYSALRRQGATAGWRGEALEALLASRSKKRSAVQEQLVQRALTAHRLITGGVSEAKAALRLPSLIGTLRQHKLGESLKAKNATEILALAAAEPLASTRFNKPPELESERRALLASYGGMGKSVKTLFKQWKDMETAAMNLPKSGDEASESKGGTYPHIRNLKGALEVARTNLLKEDVRLASRSKMMSHLPPCTARVLFFVGRSLRNSSDFAKALSSIAQGGYEIECVKFPDNASIFDPPPNSEQDVPTPEIKVADDKDDKAAANKAMGGLDYILDEKTGLQSKEITPEKWSEELKARVGAATPTDGSGIWLRRCVEVFEDGVDLEIPRTFRKSSSFRDWLEGEEKRFKGFQKPPRIELSSVQATKGAVPGETSLDTEMMQEQEQSQEAEVEREKDDFTNVSPPIDETPWEVEETNFNCMVRGEIPTTFFNMSQVQLTKMTDDSTWSALVSSKSTHSMGFPTTMYSTSNFIGQKSSQPQRLRNVHFVLRFAGGPHADKHSWIFVTLSEAETLLHSLAATKLGGSGAVSSPDGLGGNKVPLTEAMTVLSHRLELFSESGLSLTGDLQVAAPGAVTPKWTSPLPEYILARYFECRCFLSSKEVAILGEELTAAEDRISRWPMYNPTAEDFFFASVFGRRRDAATKEEVRLSPIGSTFDKVDRQALQEIEAISSEFRALVEKKYERNFLEAFARLDDSLDGTIGFEELEKFTRTVLEMKRSSRADIQLLAKVLMNHSASQKENWDDLRIKYSQFLSFFERSSSNISMAKLKELRATELSQQRSTTRGGKALTGAGGALPAQLSSRGLLGRKSGKEVLDQRLRKEGSSLEEGEGGTRAGSTQDKKPETLRGPADPTRVLDLSQAGELALVRGTSVDVLNSSISCLAGHRVAVSASGVLLQGSTSLAPSHLYCYEVELVEAVPTARNISFGWCDLRWVKGDRKTMEEETGDQVWRSGVSINCGVMCNLETGQECPTLLRPGALVLCVCDTEARKVRYHLDGSKKPLFEQSIPHSALSSGLLPLAQCEFGARLFVNLGPELRDQEVVPYAMPLSVVAQFAGKECLKSLAVNRKTLQTLRPIVGRMDVLPSTTPTKLDIQSQSGKLVAVLDGILVVSGKVYFEVSKLTSSDWFGFGWMAGGAEPKDPANDKRCWGMDWDYAVKLHHNKQSEKLDVKARRIQTIGVALDMAERRVSFYADGKALSKASFEGISARMGMQLYVSFKYCDNLSLNLAPQRVPPGYQKLQDYIQMGDRAPNGQSWHRSRTVNDLASAPAPTTSGNVRGPGASPQTRSSPASGANAGAKVADATGKGAGAGVGVGPPGPGGRASTGSGTPTTGAPALKEVTLAVASGVRRIQKKKLSVEKLNNLLAFMGDSNPAVGSQVELPSLEEVWWLRGMSYLPTMRCKTVKTNEAEHVVRLKEGKWYYEVVILSLGEEALLPKDLKRLQGKVEEKLQDPDALEALGAGGENKEEDMEMKQTESKAGEKKNLKTSDAEYIWRQYRQGPRYPVFTSLGWCDGGFTTDFVSSGCGDDRASWGYSGCVATGQQEAGRFRHNSSSKIGMLPNSEEPLSLGALGGPLWKPGDRIGLAADLDKGELRFFLNDEPISTSRQGPASSLAASGVGDLAVASIASSAQQMGATGTLASRRSRSMTTTLVDHQHSSVPAVFSSAQSNFKFIEGLAPAVSLSPGAQVAICFGAKPRNEFLVKERYSPISDFVPGKSAGAVQEATTRSAVPLLASTLDYLEETDRPLDGGANGMPHTLPSGEEVSAELLARLLHDKSAWNQGKGIKALDFSEAIFPVLPDRKRKSLQALANLLVANIQGQRVWASLQFLNLSHVPLNNDGAWSGGHLLAAFSPDGQYKLAVEAVNLSGCGLMTSGEDDVATLLSLLCSHPTVRRLDLSNNDLGLEGGRVLAAGLRATHPRRHLLTLIVRNCGLLPALQELSGALADNTYLQELDLSDNMMGLEGAQHIGKAFEFNRTLRTLRVASNQLMQTSLCALTCYLSESLDHAGGANSRELHRLDLSGNCLGPACVDQVLVPLFHTYPKLLSVNLSSTAIGARGASQLLANLSPHFQELILAGIMLTGMGDELVEALARSTSLKSLDISNSLLSALDLEKLVGGRKKLAQTLPLTRFVYRDPDAPLQERVLLLFALKIFPSLVHVDLGFVSLADSHQVQRFFAQPLTFLVSRNVRKFDMLLEYLASIHNHAVAERSETGSISSQAASEEATAFKRLTDEDSPLWRYERDLPQAVFTLMKGDSDEADTVHLAHMLFGPNLSSGIEKKTETFSSAIDSFGHKYDSITLEFAVDHWGCGSVDAREAKTALLGALSNGRHKAAELLLRRCLTVTCAARVGRKVVKTESLTTGSGEHFLARPDLLNLSGRDGDRLCALRIAALNGWWDLVQLMRSCGGFSVEAGLFVELEQSQQGSSTTSGPNVSGPMAMAAVGKRLPVEWIQLDGGGRNLLHDIARSPFPMCADSDTMIWLAHEAASIYQDCFDGSADLILQQDKHGQTALHWSCITGRPELVKRFVQRAKALGVLPQLLATRNNEGITPLGLALFYKHVRLVTFLLDAGADPVSRTDLRDGDDAEALGSNSSAREFEMLAADNQQQEQQQQQQKQQQTGEESQVDGEDRKHWVAACLSLCRCAGRSKNGGYKRLDASSEDVESGISGASSARNPLLGDEKKEASSPSPAKNVVHTNSSTMGRRATGETWAQWCRSWCCGSSQLNDQDAQSAAATVSAYDIALMTYNVHLQRNSSKKGRTPLNQDFADDALCLALAQQQLAVLGAHPAVIAERNSWIWRYVQHDVRSYLVFVVLLSYCAADIFMGHSSEVFLVTSAELDAMWAPIKKESDGGLDDVWDYLIKKVAPHLFGHKSVWCSDPADEAFALEEDEELLCVPQGWRSDFSKVLGAVRLRSKRQQMGKCHSPSHFGAIGSHCRQLGEIQHDFKPKAAYADIAEDWFVGAFKWRPAPLESYVVDLPGSIDADEALRRLKLLEDAGWMDFKTSEMELEYSVWNPQVQRHIVASFQLWVQSTGTVEGKYHMATIPWSDWRDWTSSKVFASGEMGIKHGDWAVILLVLLSLRYMLTAFWEMSKRLRSSAKAFFEDIGGLSDGANWILLLVVLGIRAYHIFCEGKVPAAADTNDAAFIDCGQLLRLYTFEMLGFGVLVFMSWMKLLTFMRLVPVLGPHSMALFTALLNQQILVFFIFFCLVTLALSLGIHVAFGSSLKGYSSIANSYFSAFQAMLGDVSLEQLQGVHYVSGTILFFLITIVFSQFVTSTFISVISSSYQETVKRSEESWQESINRFMAKHVTTRLNIDLTRADLQRQATLALGEAADNAVVGMLDEDDLDGDVDIEAPLPKTKQEQIKPWHWAPTLPKVYAQALESDAPWPEEEDKMQQLSLHLETMMQDKSNAPGNNAATLLTALALGRGASQDSGSPDAGAFGEKLLQMMAELNDRVGQLEVGRGASPAAAAGVDLKQHGAPAADDGAGGASARNPQPRAGSTAAPNTFAKKLVPGNWCHSSSSNRRPAGGG